MVGRSASTVRRPIAVSHTKVLPSSDSTDSDSTEVSVGTGPAGGGADLDRARRRFGATGIVLLALVGLVFALGRTPELPGLVRDPAPQVDGMTFLDHGNPQGPREVDLIPPDGHLTLLYFGYLSCPDICPMTMVDISRAQDRIGTELASRTQVAFVTVDPARDEPARLRDYLSLFFDGDVLALTAPDERVLDRAREELGLRFEIAPHAPGTETYDVAHSALIYVIDHTGTVVRELPFGISPEDIAVVLEASLT